MGRRGANQTAVFFAALGTLACGFSSNMNVLIAARFVSLGHLYDETHAYQKDVPFQLGGLGGGGIMTTATYVSPNLPSVVQRVLILNDRIITSDMYSLRVSEMVASL